MFHYHSDVQRPAASNSKPDERTQESSAVYDCDMCDSGDWLSETEVEIHKKTTHARAIKKEILNMPHVCWSCAKSFPDNSKLIEHIKYYHLYSSKTARRIEREIFICYYCGQIFFNKELLQVHIAIRHRHSTSLVLKCPLCHKKKKVRAMYSHITGSHALTSVSVCRICLAKQENTTALIKHIDTHTKHLHCNICGYVSLREKDFNFHLDQYERKVKRFDIKNYKEYFLYPCKRLKHSFFAKLGLSGVNIFNELYICVLCRQLCTSHSEMQEHILRDHTSDPVIIEATKKVCTCGEQFSTMILLKHHMLKSEGDHRIMCPQMNKTDPNSVEIKLEPEKAVTESSIVIVQL